MFCFNALIDIPTNGIYEFNITHNVLRYCVFSLTEELDRLSYYILNFIFCLVSLLKVCNL